MSAANPSSVKLGWPEIECRAIVGTQKQSDGIYITLCSRFRGHFGRCEPHTRHAMIRSYYDINRETWPDMTKRRALWSAWRCWRMTKDHAR